MKTLLIEGIDDQKVIEKLLKRRKIEFADFTITNGEGLDKLQDLRITPLSPPASGGKSLHAMFRELPPVDGGTEGGNA